MPIDRDSTLKVAEKLLRQGKLDEAIAEYVRLTADHPLDWSSVNALGDLYLRAGQTERAIAQFVRVGDSLLREGALAKAAAVYRKILRINPLDPRGTRGLTAVADKEAPRAVPQPPPPQVIANPDEKMKASRVAQDEADAHRACELLVEAADMYAAANRPWDEIAAIAEASSVDPANPDLRQRLIAMLIKQGEIVQARYVARVVPELLMVADAFERQGRHAEALEIKTEAAAFDENNLGVRHRLLTEFAASGEIDRARRLARSVSELLVVAEALARENRSADVIEVIGEAVQRAPNNAALRKQFVSACLALGEVERARLAARTTPELLSVADALDGRGDAATARQIRTDALRREPTDPALRTRLIHDYYKAGDLEQVRWLLTPETAGKDPALLRMLARLEFSAGRADEARRVLTRLLVLPGDHSAELLGLSRELAEQQQPESAYACAELVAESAAGMGHWEQAAAGLEEFLVLVPHHVPALMKLVEICVDGGMDRRMYAAQGRLADAYIEAGRAYEARVIAEDLVARAPWQRSNLERCRRAIRLTGDETPDRTIANLLIGDNPISLEDL